VGVATAAVLQALVGAFSPVIAHHPGGGAEPLVLIDGRKDGYRAILEVIPPEPVAGRSAQFMLWVRPERWGYEYRGKAQLSIRDQSPASATPTVLPMPEEGRGAGVYLLEHRFDRGGTYRVEVELEDLPAKWSGALRVDTVFARWAKAMPFVVIAALAVAVILFLGWREHRRLKAP
jgi:hypothetical protein